MAGFYFIGGYGEDALIKMFFMWKIPSLRNMYSRVAFMDALVGNFFEILP